MDSINPDGIRIYLRWNELRNGSVFFIPCIDENKARKQLNYHAEAGGFKFDFRRGVHDGYSGLYVRIKR